MKINFTGTAQGEGPMEGKGLAPHFFCEIKKTQRFSKVLWIH